MKISQLSSLMIGLLLAGMAYASPVKIMTADDGDCENPDASICIYLDTQILDAQPESYYNAKGQIRITVTINGVPTIIPFPASIDYSDTSGVFWLSAEATEPNTSVDSMKINITNFSVNKNATSVDPSCANLLAPGIGKYTIKILGNTRSVQCSIRRF